MRCASIWAPKQAQVLFFFSVLICVPVSPAAAQQSASQTSRAQKPGTKQDTLLVDTDDTCHLFVDDDDKGEITPAATLKFNVAVGEHILKCRIDEVPDLVWRKVVDVKDAEQAAAIVSLKALHLQYNQAVAKAKAGQDEAIKQMEKAEDSGPAWWCYGNVPGVNALFYSDVFSLYSGSQLKQAQIEDEFKIYLRSNYRQLLPSSTTSPSHGDWLLGDTFAICDKEDTTRLAESVLESRMKTDLEDSPARLQVRTGWKYGATNAPTNVGGNSSAAQTNQ